MDGEKVFIADCIKKRRSRHGKVEFLVKWKGFPNRMNTWEPEYNILDPGLILEFEERLAEEYKRGRPGRKPANLKDLKNKRRELLAKCKEYQLLSKQAKLQQERHEQASLEKEEIGCQDSMEAHDGRCNKTPCTDMDTPDANANFTRVDKDIQNGQPKTVKKPAFLQLDDRHSPAGNCHDARSPIAGCLPSPTVPRPPNSATYMGCDTPIASPNTMDSKPPSPTTNVTIPTNTVKLGKFALLRKYRNSMEETSQVSVTNVTIGDVTIAITESNTPKGFFRKYEAESACW
ncbi:M-phase phosphoprotein 8-like [Acanthaster planci]|uniref:M-phase phosphoprotein 8-like n=1 Tax=Acanthaster planci TaxID=133434 RepID=A0A8B7ZF36_ACAPL|nr:M-phase phosphoprotein 8-like [Acanthaster planci]